MHQALAAYFEHGALPELFINGWLARNVGKPNMQNSFADRLLDSIDEIATNATHATNKAIQRIEEEGWVPLEIELPHPHAHLHPIITDGTELPSPSDPRFAPAPRKKAVELELRTSLPFAPAFEYFASHIDLIAYHPATARTWLLDFKVRSKFTAYPMEDVNLQAMIYALMCIFQDIPITGTGTLEINASPPQIPKLNNDGSMSRTTIATDWITYKNALERAWLNPLDYEDMKAKLNKPWTRLSQEFRPPDMLQKVWEKLIVPTATLMSDIMLSLDEHHRSSSIMRNLGPFQCNGCGVREVCLAGLYDRDLVHLLEARNGRSEAIAAALEHGAL